MRSIGLETVVSFTLACAGLPAFAGECPGWTEKIATQVVAAPVAGLVIEVPEGWDCEVQEHADAVTVKDRSSGCRLEVYRSRSAESAAGARMLHERVYLGKNLLDEECAKKTGQALAWASDAQAGEYVLRLGEKVHAFFAVKGDEVLVGMVRCPTRARKCPSWTESTAMLASLRDMPQPQFPRLPCLGVFTAAYFFLNSPLNLFQTPTSDETRSGDADARR